MSARIANFSKVVTRDVDDRPTDTSRAGTIPEYIGFWADTMEDLFRSYDLDGIQWGAERQGPLMNVISPVGQQSADVFLRALPCARQARPASMPERARHGFTELLRATCRDRWRSSRSHADGMFVGFLPRADALSGDSGVGISVPPRARGDRRRDVQARQGDQADGRGRLARRSSAVELGYRLSRRDELRGDGAARRLHQDHRVSQRARRRGSATGICRASRRRSSARSRSRRRSSCTTTCSATTRRVEPTLDELGTKGFSPDYVVSRDEAQRRQRERQDEDLCRASASTCPAARATIRRRSTRRRVKAFEAGANGIVVSREYECLTPSSASRTFASCTAARSPSQTSPSRCSRERSSA